MNIVKDSHCHPLRTLMRPSLFEKKWLDAQVQQFVFCTTHPSEWPKAIEFVQELNHLKSLLHLGIHPWWVSPYSDEVLLKTDINQLEELIILYPHLNIGECGLDASIKKKASLELQEKVLLPQLKIAHQYKRKINLHCVKATGRLQTLISKLPGLQFTLHSYKGSRESTEIWIRLGARFSLGTRSFIWEELQNTSHKQTPTLTTLQKLFKEEPHRIGFESDAPDAGDARTIQSLYKAWSSALN